MKPYIIIAFIIYNLVKQAIALIPPRFQWKSLDYAWEGNFKCKAQSTRAYIPENNMPTGLARWKDKLFITVPRWKKGVPASLNFVRLNGSQQEPLTPYPNWREAFLMDDARQLPSNATVVSAFRAHVDSCDRLWVVDNGVTDMSNENRQIVEPAVVIFDLNKDRLLRRYDLGGDVLRDSSVLSSIVVDIAGKGCDDAYAYITDRGSNALIVYSLKTDEAWRVENHYFHFEPHAGIYKVGGVEFYWNDGVSSAALSSAKSDGHRDLYLHPTSCTKQFKMSTKLLRRKDALQEDIFTGVELVGEKGPDTQASACDYDVKNNVLFYTQLCKNAIGCWNTDKPFTPENNLVLIKDCNVLEFPNDIKVDLEKDPNLWILSNRQSRFLYGNNMDFSQINFRVLTAPTSVLIRGTPCEKPSALGKVFGCFSAKKNARPNSADGKKNARTNSADSKNNAKGSKGTSKTQIESIPCPTDGKVGKNGESCCKSPQDST